MTPQRRKGLATSFILSPQNLSLCNVFSALTPTASISDCALPLLGERQESSSAGEGEGGGRLQLPGGRARVFLKITSSNCNRVSNKKDTLLSTARSGFKFSFLEFLHLRGSLMHTHTSSAAGQLRPRRAARLLLAAANSISTSPEIHQPQSLNDIWG